MPTKKTTKAKEIIVPPEELHEFEMTAVIPVAQYANVQPIIKGYGRTYEEARDDARGKLDTLWAMYAENKDALKLAKPSTSPTVPMETMTCWLTGDKVEFEPISHKYYHDGKQLLSGSVFAGQFEHEFNADMIAPRCEKKLQDTADNIKLYWQSRADISTTFGTAMHQAMEHYVKWHQMIPLDVDSKTGEEKGHGIHPVIAPFVEAYFKGKDMSRFVAEPFVVDLGNGRCGQIDLVEVTGEKKCILRDYKTNGDLDKMGQQPALKSPYTFLPNTPFGRYTLQLSFYKAIFEAAGWTVEKCILDHFNGKEWVEREIKPQQLDVKDEPIDLKRVLS